MISNKVYVSGNCDEICYTRTKSEVHIHTCHGVITRQSKEKRENINVNVSEKNDAENCSRPVESNYYLVKFGDIVDVVFDVIDESQEILEEWKLFERTTRMVTVKSVR